MIGTFFHIYIFITKINIFITKINIFKTKTKVNMVESADNNTDKICESIPQYSPTDAIVILGRNASSAKEVLCCFQDVHFAAIASNCLTAATL
jgi:hypothetical protein